MRFFKAASTATTPTPRDEINLRNLMNRVGDIAQITIEFEDGQIIIGDTIVNNFSIRGVHSDIHEWRLEMTGIGPIYGHLPPAIPITAKVDVDVEVRWKCHFCGQRNDDADNNCVGCGASWQEQG